MKIKSVNTKKLLGITVAALLVVSQAALFMHRASADTLGVTMVRFDRMEISTPTTGTVCAQPTGAGTVASVVVTFPTGYTLGSTTDFTVDTTNDAWPSSATAWPGINTATNVSSQSVTFPSSNLSDGTLYCFNWTSAAAVTTASSASDANAGTVVTRTSTPTTIDTGNYVTSTVSNDQIAVSASVPQAFSFALNANSDDLGTLSTASVSSSPTPRAATVNTNAENGWMVWAKDAYAGLKSTNAGYTLPSTTPGSNSTLTANTAGYNMGVVSSQDSGTGTITVAVPFVGGSAGKGGGLNTGYATIASSDGPGANSKLTLTNNAAISATTPAATDYTDTITIVGAGLF